MTNKEIGQLVAGIAPAIHQRMQTLSGRIRDLEARLEKMETTKTPGVQYRGTYASDRTYASGCLVTRRGGLWLALCETFMPPGESNDWKLIVKSGGLTEKSNV